MKDFKLAILLMLQFYATIWITAVDAVNDENLRIFGGDTVPVGGIPFQAAVYQDDIFHCGGALIHPQWVLTGGQCIYIGRPVQVLLGVHNISAEAEDSRQSFLSKVFFRHENFSLPVPVNDIALVKLPQAALLTDAVKTIDLPPTNADLKDGVNVTMSGWGWHSDIFPGMTQTLRAVNVTTLSNVNCSSYFTDGEINPTNLCTSTAKHGGACIGDGGGPVTVLDKATGELNVRGIVSFGHSGPCDGGYPNVHTRVSHYLHWINDIIKNN